MGSLKLTHRFHELDFVAFLQTVREATADGPQGSCVRQKFLEFSVLFPLVVGKDQDVQASTAQWCAAVASGCKQVVHASSCHACTRAH
jgi:hypothetical protein